MFCKQFSPLRYRILFLEASKKANLSFKRPSLKPHLNRTGSVFALPIFLGLLTQHLQGTVPKGSRGRDRIRWEKESIRRPAPVQNFSLPKKMGGHRGGGLRGNTIRGNRPERFWEGNLPLRGSLRGPLRGMVSELFRAFRRFLEVFRGFQRFSEVFRGFQRFLEVFRGFSKALSETLSETPSECHLPLRVAGRVAPDRVAP